MTLHSVLRSIATLLLGGVLLLAPAARASVTITVSTTGTGVGTVTSASGELNCGSACSATFDGVTVLTLSATPAAGSVFLGWGGSCTGTGTCIVVTFSSFSVSARFDPAPELRVTCRVFDDGYANATGYSGALYLRAPWSACVPDGTSTGACRKWFGQCSLPDGTPVWFRAFNDGGGAITGLSDALYARAASSVCVPDGTAAGACRKWFGAAQTADGRQVVCYLFNDGGANLAGPTGAVYFRTNGQVCMPDGTATGTCRKWFGACSVRP